MAAIVSTRGLATILERNKYTRAIMIFILKILELLIKHRNITIRSGLAKGMKRRYGFGFVPKFSITEEEKFLVDLDFSGKVVFDVGGYVGIHTIFFSRAVGTGGRVITFEPNPRNFEELLYNVELNRCPNVTLIQIGLGKRNEYVELVYSPIFLARGTVDKGIGEQILRKGGARTVTVEVTSLDKIMEIRKLPKPDFIKIDVEGAEMDVLYGMAKTIDNYKADLFIEIHAELPAEMLDYLITRNYNVQHIESNATIGSHGEQVIRGGHIFCSYRLDKNQMLRQRGG